MNRSLEKKNEGEKLTKQETKKSGEISDTFKIWQWEATSEAKGVWGQSPQPPTDF